MRAVPPESGVELQGIQLAAVTESETVALVVSALDRGEGGRVATVNLDILRQCASSGVARGLVASATFAVADGQPLVWASRLKGQPLPERVAGSNLIWSLSREAAARGHRVFLLGGEPGTAEKTAARLVEAAPRLRIAGTACPPHGFDRAPDRVEEIVRVVAEATPRVVYVALPFPRQELMIERLRTALPDAWFLGVGISFSFVSGHVRRAPVPVQRLGLEWVHRLAQEPRLLRRYGLDLLFAPRLFAGALAARRCPPPRR